MSSPGQDDDGATDDKGPLIKLEGPSDPIRRVCVTGESTLCCGSWTPSLYQYDLSASKEASVMKKPVKTQALDGNSVMFTCHSPNGKLFFAVGDMKQLLICEGQNVENILKTVQINVPGQTTDLLSIAVSSTHICLGSAHSSNSYILVYKYSCDEILAKSDSSTACKLVKTLNKKSVSAAAAASPQGTFHTDSIDCLAITTDRRLLISGSEDGSMKFWRLGEPTNTRCLETFTPLGKGKRICTLAVSGDNKLAIGGKGSRKLVVLADKAGNNLENCKPGSSIAILKGSESSWSVDSDMCACARWSPCSKLLIASYSHGNKSGSIRVFDVSSNIEKASVMYEHKESDGPVWGVIFAPKISSIVYCGKLPGGYARVHKLESKKKLIKMLTEGAETAAGGDEFTCVVRGCKSQKKSKLYCAHHNTRIVDEKRTVVEDPSSVFGGRCANRFCSHVAPVIPELNTLGFCSQQCLELGSCGGGGGGGSKNKSSSATAAAGGGGGVVGGASGGCKNFAEDNSGPSEEELNAPAQTSGHCVVRMCMNKKNPDNSLYCQEHYKRLDTNKHIVENPVATFKGHCANRTCPCLITAPVPATLLGFCSELCRHSGRCSHQCRKWSSASSSSSSSSSQNTLEELDVPAKSSDHCVVRLCTHKKNPDNSLYCQEHYKRLDKDENIVENPVVALQGHCANRTCTCQITAPVSSSLLGFCHVDCRNCGRCPKTCTPWKNPVKPLPWLPAPNPKALLKLEYSFKERLNAGYIRRVDATPGTSRVVAATGGNATIVYDTEKKQSLAKLQDHEASVNGVCHSFDGKYFFTVGLDARVIQYDAHGKFDRIATAIPDPEEEPEDPMQPCALFSCAATNSTVVVSFHKIHVLSFAKKGELMLMKTLEGHKARCGSLAVSRLDGGATAYSGGEDGFLKTWNIQDSNSTTPIFAQQPHINKERGVLRTIAVSPSGKFLASADSGGEGATKGDMILWDIEKNPQKPVKLKVLGAEQLVSQSGFIGVRFSPCSTMLVIVCWEDRQLRIVNVPEGKQVVEPATLDAEGYHCCFGGLGKRIVAATDAGDLELFSNPFAGWTRANVELQTKQAKKLVGGAGAGAGDIKALKKTLEEKDKVLAEKEKELDKLRAELKEVNTEVEMAMQLVKTL